jgi:hypothetical protein
MAGIHPRVFALLRWIVLVVLVLLVVAGSLTFVSRASCRSGGEHGKRQIEWSVGLPGSKPKKGCRDRQSGLTYFLDQIGLG